MLIFQFLTNYVKDFSEGSPMNPLPPPPPFPNLLISKKSSPCQVKLRMSIKTIQLICNAL